MITDIHGNIVDSMSFDAWGNRRDRVNWEQPDTAIHLIDRGFTMHQHLDVFKLINMGGRVYDPVVQQFLSPDPYVQAPDNTQNLNRYAYCLNSPLMYTDPTGEFVWIPMVIGAVVGAYIGAATAEGGELNPTKWTWQGKTWAGLGLGAVIGAAAGIGAGYMAPALSQTAFFSHFGLSGTIAAYSLAGTVAGGIAGYGAGFAGGMLYSGGNLKYSHQSGLFGSQIGSMAGSVVGGIAGLIAGYTPPKPRPPYATPQQSKWNGRFFQGSEEEAKKMMLSSSKLFKVETSAWYTSKGYYFEPIEGESYFATWNNDLLNPEIYEYNIPAGYKYNTITSSKRYVYLDKVGDYLYLANDFMSYARVYYHLHTHPGNSTESPADLIFARMYGMMGVIFGWNGATYWYGGYESWR
jgi:RHS repeat-associated protein